MSRRATGRSGAKTRWATRYSENGQGSRRSSRSRSTTRARSAMRSGRC
jgi:hypothetical protein